MQQRQPFMIDADTESERVDQMNRLIAILNAPLGIGRPAWWRPVSLYRWWRDQATLQRAKLAALVAANHYAFSNIVAHQFTLGKLAERFDEVRNGLHLLHGQVQEIQQRSGEPSTLIN